MIDSQIMTFDIRINIYFDYILLLFFLLICIDKT